MPAYFSTVVPSEVKSMDAIPFLDNKKYTYSCEDCKWVGSELELDVISLVHLDMVSCPHCQSDDVRVVN